MLTMAMAPFSPLNCTRSLFPRHLPSPSLSPPPQAVGKKRWPLSAAVYSSSSSSSSVSDRTSPSLVFSDDPLTMSSLSLYSLKDRKIHTINPPKPSYCIGAGHGWLVVADHVSADLTLFNPATDRTLPLPKNSTFSNVTPILDSDGRLINYTLTLKTTPLTFGFDPQCLPVMLILRALVVSNTNINSDHNALDRDFTIFVVLRTPTFGLAYAKPGDSEWTMVDFKDDCLYLDVIRHKNRIHSVMYDGSVCEWEFGGLFPTRPKMTLCVEDNEIVAYKSRAYRLIEGDIWFYLVTSSSGDLLRVRKERVGDEGKVSIKVHKVEGGKLVEVKSLGEDAILLGSNSAVCISAADFPCLKGNHVYVAENFSSPLRCDVLAFIAWKMGARSQFLVWCLITLALLGS